jgi:hypothetical protein
MWREAVVAEVDVAFCRARYLRNLRKKKKAPLLYQV